MPRPKKPAHLAADRRNGQRTQLAVPDGSRLARPEMPAGLEEAGRLAWDEYWSDPVSAAFTMADAELVREYVGAVGRRALYQRRLDAEPVTEGSQGQLVVAPWAKLLSREDQLITAARDRLGLSPKSRAMLGIAIGEAQRTAADLLASTPAAGPQHPAVVASSREPGPRILTAVEDDDDPRRS